MNEFLNGITGKITIISIAAFVFGSCIITYHLSSFQILDYDLLKPHAVIVGLVYLLFLGINVIVFSYRAGSIEDNRFSIFQLIVLGLIKIPFISLIIFSICEPSLILNSDYKLYFFPYSLDIKVFAIVIITQAFAIITATLSVKKEGEEEKKFNKRGRNLYIFLSILSIALLFLTFIKHSTFLSILSLEVFICLMVNAFIIGYRSARLHDERAIENNEKKTNWADDSFFNFGKSELGIQLKKLFNVLLVIFLALKITLNYTTDIYSNLSQAYGGGKLIKMSFVTGKDTITGSKVYETNEYLFLSKKDSTIIKLDWKDINSILKNPIK